MPVRASPAFTVDTPLATERHPSPSALSSTNWTCWPSRPPHFAASQAVSPFRSTPSWNLHSWSFSGESANGGGRGSGPDGRRMAVVPVAQLSDRFVAAGPAAVLLETAFALPWAAAAEIAAPAS